MDLGLERAGMTCRWQVEIDPYASRVLAKHWPEVKRYGDIRELSGAELERVDCIVGGFPCQDVSVAGLRRGIGGTRSGLYADMVRLVCVVRPRIVLMENVTGLLIPAGADEPSPIARVLGDLAESGYDANWDCIPAAEFGLPHQRERIFILAYSTGFGWPILSDQSRLRSKGQCLSNHEQSGYRWKRQNRRHSVDALGWSVEPDIRGSNDGVPFGMERLRALGNAVVPQVAEWIGRRIIEADLHGHGYEIVQRRDVG